MAMSVEDTQAANAIEQDEESNKKSTLQRVEPGANSSSDQLLLNRVRQMYTHARAYKKPLHQRWLKSYRVLQPRTWITGRADWLPAPEVPEVYPIISTLVAWMTDQRPMFECLPAAQPSSPFYEWLSALSWDLQTVMYANWQNYKHEAEVAKMLWDGAVYGVGFLKTTWDDALDGGLGDVSIKRIDPFTIFPDPMAANEEDATYIIEARKYTIEELDRRFPGAAEAIGGEGLEMSDAAPTRLDQSSTSMPRANPGAISPATSPRYGMPGGAGRDTTRGDQRDGIVVLECWMRDHDFSDPDEDGDIDVYDYWRVVIVAGNKILLNEKAEDIWGHARHPYARYVPEDSGEFWGQSMVELLAPAQLTINRLLASYQLNIELTGNPVLLEGAKSGIQRTKMTNKPGARVTINENSKVEWMQPPQVSPGFQNLIQFYLAEMERISGLSAMTRGATPGGRNSGDTLDAVQDASFVRVRAALRNLEYTLRTTGQLAASLICEFYDTPRFIASVGPDGTTSSLALHGKHFYLPVEGDKNASAPMKFALLVNAGSQMPISSNARRSDASTLFAMGAIDREAVLSAFNFPNRAAVLKRVNAAIAAGTFQPPGARQKSQRSS